MSALALPWDRGGSLHSVAEPTWGRDATCCYPKVSEQTPQGGSSKEDLCRPWRCCQPPATLSCPVGPGFGCNSCPNLDLPLLGTQHLPCRKQFPWAPASAGRGWCAHFGQTLTQASGTSPKDGGSESITEPMLPALIWSLQAQGPSSTLWGPCWSQSANQARKNEKW